MTTAETFMEAAKAGDVDRLRQLIVEDPGLVGARSPSGETPLMAALYRGHSAVVEALVGAGAPLDIFAAAALGRTDELDAALHGPAGTINSFAYDGWSPLHLAAFFGRRAAALSLLGGGADVTAVSRNSLRNTPLHAATAGNHSDVALVLIEHGAPVDVRDAGGHTPLHIAAETGAANVVKALLDRGADPHAVDSEDKTPLSRAAARNHSAIIDLINAI